MLRKVQWIVVIASILMINAGPLAADVQDHFEVQMKSFNAYMSKVNQNRHNRSDFYWATRAQINYSEEQLPYEYENRRKISEPYARSMNPYYFR